MPPKKKSGREKLPPKEKSGIQKLHEQLKKQKQNKQKPKSVKTTGIKKIPARPKTHHDIERATKEDEAVREFFAKLVKLSDLRVESEIQKFSTDPKGAWGRQRFFDKMLGVLPEKYYKEFAQEYLDQNTQNLNNFWEYYSTMPEVAQAIKEKAGDIDPEEIFEKKRERLRKKREKKDHDAHWGNSDSEDDDEEEEDEEFTYYGKEEEEKRTPRKIKFIGDDGEVIELPSPQIRKQQYQSDIDPNCLQTYRTIPWINARVESVYIIAEPGTDIAPYTIAGEEIEENGETWYKAGNSFTKLMCNIYARNRVQDGEVLTVFTNSGLPIRVRLGYKTNRGFIVQDEKIFQKEKEYYKEKRVSQEDKIKRILDQPMSEKYKRIGMESLSLALNKVAPDVKDYGIHIKPKINPMKPFDDDGGGEYINIYDTSYIVTAINTIYNKSSTVRDFFTKIGHTVAYLTLSESVPLREKPPYEGAGDIIARRKKGIPDPPTHFLVGEIFRDRIKAEYYLPEILVNLTPEEKLPEYFDDPRITKDMKEKIQAQIDIEIKDYVRKIGNSLFRLEYPDDTEWRQPIPMYNPVYLPEIEKWKSACKNQKDIKNLPNYQIIYYKEGDDIWCLNIEEIAKQIANGDEPVNPYTNKPLTKSFVDKFKKLYDLNLVNKGFGGSEATPTPSPARPSKPETPEYCPELLKMIEDNILECEKELEGGDLTEDGKCKGLDDDSDENSGDETEEDTGEETEEEIIENLDTQSSSSDSPNLTQNKCHYCGKKTNGEIKTIIDSSEGFKPVEFCCIKCFEDQDKWPRERSKKKKGKKSKKSKHGKKGGRNSTKERQSKK